MVHAGRSCFKYYLIICKSNIVNRQPMVHTVHSPQNLANLPHPSYVVKKT